VGEEEMMIVGTVLQEDSYSWQDASRSWLEQDEGEEVGIYQVGARQGADESPVGVGKEAIACPPGKGRRGAEAAEDDCWASGPSDLLIEGEEGEYFIELLMRERSSGEPGPANGKAKQPAKKEEDSKGEAAPAGGKGKKKDKKRAARKGKGAVVRPLGGKELLGRARERSFGRWEERPAHRKRKREARRANRTSSSGQHHLTPAPTLKPRAGA
jgi:hypothetical protein